MKMSDDEVSGEIKRWRGRLERGEGAQRIVSKADNGDSNYSSQLE